MSENLHYWQEMTHASCDLTSTMLCVCDNKLWPISTWPQPLCSTCIRARTG